MEQMVAMAAVSDLAMSTLICLLITMSAGQYLSFTADLPHSRIQQVHAVPTPRIGGIGIIAGVFAYLFVNPISGIPFGSAESVSGLALLSIALPLFLTGLIEDMTQAIRPAARLLVAVAVVLWLGHWANIFIIRTDVPLLDDLLAHKWFALGFTAFAITGFSHAINIIDGLNGLAAGVGSVLFAGVAYLASSVGDTFVFELSLAGAFALLGFAVLNFPRGWLFMGDGGAYFTGFWLSVCATLLIMRPDVSACQMIAICAFPVIETVYSMFRRFRRKKSVAAPDRLHLHSLLYRRVYLPMARRQASPPWRAHGMTSLSLMALNLIFITAAIALGTAPRNSLLVFAAEIGAYYLLYGRLVRFRWL